MNVEELELAAGKIREDFEKQNINYNLLKELYLRDNSIGDIDSFIEESKKVFPKLNCGLASVYLKEKLKVGEVVKGKYKEANHTFLLIDEEIIVDITADQFGGQKVYVGPVIYPWSF